MPAATHDRILVCQLTILFSQRGVEFGPITSGGHTAAQWLAGRKHRDDMGDAGTSARTGSANVASEVAMRGSLVVTPHIFARPATSTLQMCRMTPILARGGTRVVINLRTFSWPAVCYLAGGAWLLTPSLKWAPG